MSVAASVATTSHVLWPRFVDHWTTVSAVASMIALWFYDYFDTLPSEIMYIWCQEISWTSILFIVNRYTLLVYLLVRVAMLANDHMPNTLCREMTYLWDIAYAISEITTYGILTLRVWSISGRQRRVLMICIPLITVIIVLNLFTILSSTSTVENPNLTSSITMFEGCSFQIKNPMTINRCAFVRIFSGNMVDNKQPASLAYTAALLALQFYVFIFTMIKTWHHVLESRRLGLSGVAYIILRDGVMHFLLITSAQLLLFLLILINTVDSKSAYTSTLWINGLNLYASTLPNLVVNHLVLNLKSYSRTHCGTQRDINTISTLRFTRNIHLGDIGAPLNFCEEMDPSIDSDISVIETDDEIETPTSARHERGGSGDLEIVLVSD